MTMRAFTILIAGAIMVATPHGTPARPASQSPEPTSLETPADRALDALQEGKRLLVDGASSDDIAKALAYLETAGDDGRAEALVILGDTYRSGRYGQEVSPERAIGYYQRAADAGNAGALVKLGDVYRTGLPGLAADPAEAMAFYEQAIEKGDNTARRNLAGMLLSGQGVPADSDRGLALLEEAIDAGDAAALIALANAYRNGQGVAPDAEKAVELLEPLVAQDHTGALNTLGDLYRAGAGDVSQDLVQARSLFQRAADLGDNGATRKLGDMLVKGEGGDPDFAAGTALVEAVADRGDTGALIQLGDYYAQARYGEVSPERAIGYYQRAADAGNAGALVKLGDVYRTGLPGLAADPAEAMAFYEQAIEKGDNTARRNILLSLLRADANAYVYLLQVQMHKLGTYGSPITGRLTSATISAINAYCSTQGISSACSLGPLSPLAAEAIVSTLFE